VLRTPGAVDALREFAHDANLGVANTWNLKGLFRWDDPHHLGTVGLQARDMELLGVADAAEVIAVGVDDDEIDLSDFAHVMPVAPGDIADLDVGYQQVIERPPLYALLAEALAPLYDATKSPPSPARVLRDLAAGGAQVVARPGSRTGFWVARAFPTSELGQVRFGDAATLDWGPDEVDWSDTDVLVDVAGAVLGWGF
jgi:acetolactate synthase-1/2/3 large subunit